MNRAVDCFLPCCPKKETYVGAEMSAEALRQERKPGPGQYDVLPHVTALSSHPRAPAPSFGSEGRQCNKRAASA